MANDMHTDGRDTRSGAYDAVTPVKKQPTDHAAHPNAEGHVDIPEGLLRNRQGPLNARTGRKALISGEREALRADRRGHQG